MFVFRPGLFGRYYLNMEHYYGDEDKFEGKV